MSVTTPVFPQGLLIEAIGSASGAFLQGIVGNDTILGVPSALVVWFNDLTTAKTMRDRAYGDKICVSRDNDRIIGNHQHNLIITIGGDGPILATFCPRALSCRYCIQTKYGSVI